MMASACKRSLPVTGTQPSTTLVKACGAGRLGLHKHRQHQRNCKVASQQNNGYESPSPEVWEQGLREARELLVIAVRMAQRETRQELEDMFVGDKAQDITPVLNRDQLISFWLEQGASDRVAKQIVKEMARLPAKCCDVSFLEVRVSRLRRLLPLDVAALVARDAYVLTSDLSLAVKNMIVLVEHFPGTEVSTIIERRPSLLYVSTDELLARIQECFTLLEGCLPAWVKLKTRKKLLVENPELLFRLQHHAGKSFGELPVDIQNMVIAATGGNWWATT